MAELTGTPGKIELKFHSGNGIEEFEQKFALTNTEAAAFLKELAEEIEAGGEVSVRPIDVEVECEKDGLEIEIKLKARREEEKGEKREKEEKEEEGEEEEEGKKEEKEEKEEPSPGRA